MAGNSRRPEHEASLRRELSALSLGLRQAQGAELPLVPRFVSYDTLRQPDGRVTGRKKVILMSGGCSVPTCTMCPFTNENNYGLPPADPRLLVEQAARALARSPDEPEYDVLALYNDGSFFAPAEIPRPAQVAIAGKAATAGIRRLVVESLPQFVTAAALKPFVDALGGTELEVGIGLQSADDLVRETLVNTRVTRAAFERAITAMAELGVHPKIYLMIKPPFLTDAEALTDVMESVAYVRSLGIPGVTLCPTRVSRNTVAWTLWEAGLYQPPSLWTVAAAVRRAHAAASVRVACINLRGSDFESVFPDSCPSCADLIVDGLLAYSETGDTSVIPASCGCTPAPAPAALDHEAIIARARSQIASCAAPRQAP